MRSYEEYKRYIDDNVLSYLPQTDKKAEVLYEAMKYSLMAGGKRIRPVLCLACCELFGEFYSLAMPFASAIEFIQTYSLIHDDLPAMDNDDYRRGMLTNHKVYGEDIAILAGDGLLSAAYEVISQDMVKDYNEPEILLRKVLAFEELAKGTGCRGMVSGQVADIKSEHREISRDMLDFIHRNKTAAFIEASVMAGAYLGGAGNEDLNNLRIYAQNLGLAFQIVDDIQDVIGDEKARGKRVGGDSENEKSTYPGQFGLEESRKKAGQLLENARRAIAVYKEKAQVLNYLIEYLEGMM